MGPAQEVAWGTGPVSVAYSEVADTLGNLPRLLRDTRHDRKLTLDQVVAQTGLSRSTIAYIESGRVGSIHNAKIILRWLHDGGRQWRQQ